MKTRYKLAIAAAAVCMGFVGLGAKPADATTIDFAKAADATTVTSIDSAVSSASALSVKDDEPEDDGHRHHKHVPEPLPVLGSVVLCGAGWLMKKKVAAARKVRF